MVNCCANGCSNSSESKVSFFAFPKDRKLKKAWENQLKRAGFKPGNSARVCSVHFDLQCFTDNLVLLSKLNRPDLMPKRLHLRPDAVPTLFDYKDEQQKPIKRPVDSNEREAIYRAGEMTREETCSNGNVRSAYAKRRRKEVNHYSTSEYI